MNSMIQIGPAVGLLSQHPYQPDPAAPDLLDIELDDLFIFGLTGTGMTNANNSSLGNSYRDHVQARWDARRRERTEKALDAVMAKGTQEGRRRL